MSSMRYPLFVLLTLLGLAARAAHAQAPDGGHDIGTITSASSAPYDSVGPGFTLKEAIDELEGSPRLERAKASAESASWRRVESFSVFLPTLTATGSYLFGKRYLLTDINFGGAPVSVPAIIPTTNYALGAQWLLFDGLANVEHWRAGKAFERAGDDELAWARFEAEHQIMHLFYQALGARLVREVARQNLKTLEDHLGDVELMKRAGVGTRYDVLRVEVQASSARSEILHAEDGVMVATQRLDEYLARDGKSEYQFREPRGELPALDPKLLDGVPPSPRSQGRADLAALESRAEALGDLASAAHRHWVPKVGLFGSFQIYNNRDDQLTSSTAFRNAYSYGVQVTWNLFDGFGSTARAHEAALERIQADRLADIARIKGRTDSESARRKYLYYCALYRSRQSDVGKASESVRLAREGRKVGVRTSSDLLDAELELFRARAGVLEAQLGAVDSILNLELATGRRLYAFY